ncbi:YgaP family membrane protein [Halegenticoccus soli]|uniref:YgaP family membrane protein n=1 Tax=Halegenticoccus soli TaxID=1985678 RepID=UPI0018EB4870|nr:DUF2892 domain-containing protein [Halegenticoccus soli]
MGLEKNMSEVDRVIRGVLGIWLIVMSVGAMLDGRRVVAATTGIAGTGLLLNFATQHCGGYALLGIDTSSGESCSTS